MGYNIAYVKKFKKATCSDVLLLTNLLLGL